MLPLVSGRAPLDALVVALPVAFVFSVAPLCTAAMQVRLAGADVPAAFRGLPLAFVTAGLAALALAGLGGWTAR